MTFGRILPTISFVAALLGLAGLLGPGPVLADELSLDQLLSRLAAAGRVETRYEEVRDSPLLAEPVELRGRIVIDPDGRFVKTTEGEDAATIRMQEGKVEMVQGGDAQQVSLDRYPAMQMLTEGLFALIRGDGEALREAFRPRLEGTMADWRLKLEPRFEVDMDNPTAVKNTGIVQLTIEGQAQRIRRMVLEQTAGQRTVMTFHAPADQ